MDTNFTTVTEEVKPVAEELKLSFNGNGGDYFTIVIVNWLFTVLTLGLYYPWAKARKLRYLYNATEFNNIPFVFHGTGNEMFKGFIKAILIVCGLYGICILLFYLHLPIVAIVFLIAGSWCIVPLAIHGSYKYRMSRTSWSGIRMGYRGIRKELFGMFFKGIFLTIITLGIYGAWFKMNLRNYILNNLRFGSLKFNYTGKGGEYFFLNLKCYLLSIITLGIYSFWWQKQLIDYFINNLGLSDGETGKKFVLKNNATGGNIAGLFIVNFLLFIFTLGLAYPWIVCRTMNFIFSKIQISGDINLKKINQTEADYRDATGEDLSDMFDFGFVI